MSIASVLAGVERYQWENAGKVVDAYGTLALAVRLMLFVTFAA